MDCVSVWVLVLSDESKWEIICRDTLVPELTLCKKISRYLQMQIANRNLFINFNFSFLLEFDVKSSVNTQLYVV